MGIAWWVFVFSFFLMLLICPLMGHSTYCRKVMKSEDHPDCPYNIPATSPLLVKHIPKACERPWQTF